MLKGFNEVIYAKDLRFPHRKHSAMIATFVHACGGHLIFWLASNHIFFICGGRSQKFNKKNSAEAKSGAQSEKKGKIIILLSSRS